MALPDPAPHRTALVTGASSGIGEAIARDLVRRGHGVTLLARRADRLEALATELRSGGQRVEVLPTDLSDRSARAGLPQAIEALGLEVDILINNAGLSTLGPVASSSPEAEMNMVEVDVMAVIDLCSRFTPAMVQRRRGAILNVASTAAFQPLPGQAGYGGSKAFVVSYTQALNTELRGTGVTATILCPGPVDTGFGELAGFSIEDATKTLPQAMWVPAETVAAVGLDALAAGKVVAIPGAANRFAARVSRLIPNRLLLPLLAKNHPGLKEQ
jgi:hypothetical protein